MDTIFTFDKHLCNGCGACAVACMDQNDMNTGQGETAFRCICMTETGCGWQIKAFGCMHCVTAPCMETCPRNCFHRDPDTNFVILDSAGCIGCGACKAVCPYDALRQGTDGKMKKCNGCNDRVKVGLKPACIKVCQLQALGLADREK